MAKSARSKNAAVASVLKDSETEAGVLRSRVMDSLKEQGFVLCEEGIAPPAGNDKDSLRALHKNAVQHNIERSRAGLVRHEEELLDFIADGSDVKPEAIQPRLHQVESGTLEELLFRYVRLHWSIPVSAGYGRRLRFLVFDDSNGKLIGLFGLGDPIFNLGPRDRWIGWDFATRKQKLQSVMDLFVLGAVPPYSKLLCGKLVALLVTSEAVQKAFASRYGGSKSYISKRELDGRLALLTTISALGRSSIYNRLRYQDRLVYQSVGYTRGSGEFHFCNGVYDDLRKFALANCEPSEKNSAWGNGFRNRRELVKKTLPLLNLPKEFIYHGVEREIFVIPVAKNAQEFLCGDDKELRYFGWSEENLFEWFKDRWLLPRAVRDSSYLNYDSSDYRLWK